MLNILRLAIDRVYRRRHCSVFQLANSNRNRNTATTVVNHLIGIVQQHQAHHNPRPTERIYSDDMGDSVNENCTASSSSSSTTTTAPATTSNLPGIVKFLELVGNLKVRKGHWRYFSDGSGRVKVVCWLSVLAFRSDETRASSKFYRGVVSVSITTVAVFFSFFGGPVTAFTRKSRDKYRES